MSPEELRQNWEKYKQYADGPNDRPPPTAVEQLEHLADRGIFYGGSLLGVIFSGLEMGAAVTAAGSTHPAGVFLGTFLWVHGTVNGAKYLDQIRTGEPVQSKLNQGLEELFRGLLEASGQDPRYARGDADRVEFLIDLFAGWKAGKILAESRGPLLVAPGAVKPPAARTLADWLPGVSDDAMIHLTDAAAVELRPGVFADSYWVRFGDVKHLTLPQYKGNVVMPLAPAHGADARVFAVVEKPDPRVFKPDFHKGPQEYTNSKPVVPDRVVEVDPLPPAPFDPNVKSPPK